MLKWLSQDAPLMNLLHTIANFAVLNLLWLVCALPIITFGASTTALYSCVFSLSRGEECGCRKFFSAFKSNFKTATLSWLIILGAIVVLYADYYFAAFSDWAVGSYLLIAYGIIFIMLLLAYPFLFPLISQFHAKPKTTLKNAFLCGISWLPRTLLILILQLFPAIWLFVSPLSFLYIAWVWIFFGFALIAHLCVKLMNKPMSILRERLVNYPAAQ